MFIAMNRFRIALGRETEFEEIWRNRESHLDQVPGFREFHLLKGPTDEEATLYASHSRWDDHRAFEEVMHREDKCRYLAVLCSPLTTHKQKN